MCLPPYIALNSKGLKVPLVTSGDWEQGLQSGSAEAGVQGQGLNVGTRLKPLSESIG